MTIDNAIAILRRMQEPEAFEPQINEAAFDALEMAIQALQGHKPDQCITDTPEYKFFEAGYRNGIEDAWSQARYDPKDLDMTYEETIAKHHILNDISKHFYMTCKETNDD